MRCLVLLGFSIVLLGRHACAQPSDGEVRATALQANVVKIAATLGQNGIPQIGFGFIVGQQGSHLVIVTADHVVRGQDPDGKDVEDPSPVVTFYESQGYQAHAQLQSVSLPKGRGDLALLLVPRPDFIHYETASISINVPSRGTKVWLVGRGADWNIPATPGVVAKYDQFYNRIKVEGLSAAVGSSGGPLISADGILGMIVVDSSLVTEATPIEPIQHQVHDVWRYDWRLTPTSAPPIRRGPSYSCTDARAPVEVLICQDATLASLDLDLNELYRTTQSRLLPDRQHQLLLSQRSWIKERDKCLQRIGASGVRDCLLQAYREGMAVLRSF